MNNVTTKHGLTMRPRSQSVEPNNAGRAKPRIGLIRPFEKGKRMGRSKAIIARRSVLLRPLIHFFIDLRIRNSRRIIASLGPRGG
jgi:hypothetical protein